MRKLRKSVSGGWVPVFLLAVSVLGFGLMLPSLGFYWDDWAKILVARLWGLQAYIPYYAEDRPLSAWTHMLFTPLLGYSPLPWHIFTLLLRWLSAWGVWWVLSQLWPEARRLNLTAALLFLVYPAFVSQPAAVTFHQQWLQYALFFLSMGLMLLAQRKPARRTFWLLNVGALLAMAAQLSVTEYFVPLELLRPLVLWFLFDRDDLRSRLGRVLRAWAPYLLLTAGYVVWRLFFLQLPDGDPYRAETLYAFLQAPLATLQSTAWTVLVDEMQILFNSWANLLQIDLTQMTPFSKFSYAIGAAAAALAVFFLLRMDRAEGVSQGEGNQRRWLRQALILGLAAVLLGPLPAWITGRQVVFDFHSDRYAMPAMFGAGLLFAVGLEWLVQKRVQHALLAGVLVMLAASLNLRIANDYRWITTQEQRFFWQLSWRAPGLKAPTALYFENEPFPNQGLFSTSAALNLMYPQPQGETNLAYWVYTLRPRYNHAPDSNTIGLHTTFRSLKFEGQTPNSLLLYNDPSVADCLWVLSERDADHPYLPELVKSFLIISDLDQIEPEAARAGYPPEEMIGAELPHTGWCYYFEKADLARQQGDWAAISGLTDEALAQGYTPSQDGANSPYEWLPFIEGLGRSARWEQAVDLTRQAFEVDPKYRKMMCNLWTGSLASADGGSAAAAQVNTFLACNAP